MSTDGASTRQHPSRTGIWLGLFLAATATIVALKLTDAVNPTTAYLLFAAATGLLLPLLRALGGRHTTSASGRYGRRMILFAAIYVLDLGIAIAVDEAVGVRGWFTALFALLPTVPILGMIWAMGRYLIEETDEFLRYRAAMAALIGLGVLLALATFVGFLERFGLNFHPEGWLALPVWALGMGLGRAWLAVRDQPAAEDVA